MELSRLAVQFLEKCGVKFSYSFIQSRIQTHPDYPSLVSLTDTLDEMGLTYSAIICEKVRYQELHFPLLAYVNKNGKNNFVLVDYPDQFTENEGYLFNIWEGISLSIMKNSSIRNQEHDIYYSKQKRQTTKQIIVFVATFCLLLGMTIIHSGGFFTIIQLLSIIGALICGQIVLHNIGKSNKITKQLCSTEGKSNCNTVLRSKYSSWKGITLGDLGLIYFSGFSTYMALEKFTNYSAGSNGLLVILIFIGGFVGVASLLIQWLVIKGWCKLCFLVDFILLINVILLFGIMTPDFPAKADLFEIVLCIFSFFVPSVVWFPYKQQMQQLEANRKEMLIAARFKRRPEIFLALLQLQRQIDITPWTEDIILGNPNASLKLMVVCNPYCKPCARAHKVIESILYHFSNDISVTIRFNITSSKPIEKNELAVWNILSSWQNGNRNAVENWFDYMNLEKFKTLFHFKLDEMVPEYILQKHVDWTKKSDIKYTPSIFINRYELPSTYGLTDLALLIPLLLEVFAPKAVVRNTAE